MDKEIKAKRLNKLLKARPLEVVERGKYWYRKTGTHFHNCFGTFPIGLHTVETRTACEHNTKRSDPKYNACRECKKVTARLLGTLDEILGLI